MEKEQVAQIIARFAAGMPQPICDQLADVDTFVYRDVYEANQGFAADAEFEDAIEPLPADCKGVFVGEPFEVDEEDESMSEDAVGAIAIVASNLTSEEEVIKCLLHEIGHALGLDEGEVAALGLGAPPAPAKVESAPTP